MKVLAILCTAVVVTVAIGLTLGFAGGLPPVADAGATLWVECSGPVSVCPLNGTASYDPERDPLTYYWEDDNPNSWFDDPTSPTPTLFVDMGAACSVECGAIRLTVTDPSGQTDTDTTAVVFRDRTPPDIYRPGDLILGWDGGWPVQTDPALTGEAIGIDLRDPDPLVYYTDDVVPGSPPSGIEQIVYRTWYAEDMCGHVVSDMQTITLVGRSFYSFQLELGGGLPPVADAGPPLWVECSGQVSECPLNGTASYDPEQDPLTYLWEDDNPNSWFDDPTSPTPTLFVDMGAACSVECGAIRLTVTDPSGQTDTDTTAVVFRDQTPPDIFRPGDLILAWDGGWPFQTDPAQTGEAIGIDLRDPDPLVTYEDVVTPGYPPTGIEEIVERTWFVEDMCGHIVSDMQTITLVGPSFYDIVTMDIMPGNCPNMFSTRKHGTFSVVLFGEEGFFAGASQELGLCRADGVGHNCEPMWGTVADVGRPVDGSPCGSLDPDGYQDLVLTFDVDEAIDVMGLRAVGDTAPLTLQLQGTNPDGQPFATRDTIVVVNLATFEHPLRKVHDQRPLVDL